MDDRVRIDKHRITPPPLEKMVETRYQIKGRSYLCQSRSRFLFDKFAKKLIVFINYCLITLGIHVMLFWDLDFRLIFQSNFCF